MTNEEILNRFNAVQQVINEDAFDDTKIKFAVIRNNKRLKEAIQPYQDEMEELRDEYEEELEELEEDQEELQERLEDAEEQEEREEIVEEAQDLSAPEEFEEARQELLAKEENDPEAYTISDSYLDQEDDVEIGILYQLDWMFD